MTLYHGSSEIIYAIDFEKSNLREVFSKMKRVIIILLCLSLMVATVSLGFTVDISLAASSAPTVTSLTQQLTPFEINSYVISSMPKGANAERYIMETRGIMGSLDYKSKTIQDIANNIKIESKTEYEKFRAAYDYVISNIEYDYTDNERRVTRWHAKASDVFDARIGVCDDYSIALIALLHALDIPAAFVTVYIPHVPGSDESSQVYPSSFTTTIENVLKGSSTGVGEGHSCVLAYVDNEWRIAEPTWGDSDKQQTRDYYFDMPLDSFSEKHIIESVSIHGTSPGEWVEFGLSSAKIVINGNEVNSFKAIQWNNTYYLSYIDLAAALAQYAKESLSAYSLIKPRFPPSTGHSVYIFPGLPYNPSGEEFIYTEYPFSSVHPEGFAYIIPIHIRGAGWLMRCVELGNGNVFIQYDDICSALGIAVEYNSNINTLALQTIEYNDTYNTAPRAHESPSPSPASRSVMPTASTVFLNNKAQAFEAYNIDGNNYFKLRDLAYVLNGTEKQFEVGYDNETRAIFLKSGQPYTIVGGEMMQGDGSVKSATPTQSIIYLDGEQLSLTVYLINGNNYFKLRDLMKAINVYVGYDTQSKAITLDSGRAYLDE